MEEYIIKNVVKNSEKTGKQIAIRKSRSENLVLRSDARKISNDALVGEVVSIVGKDVVVETIIEGKLLEVHCVQTGTIVSKSKYSNLIATGDIVYFLYEKNGLSKIVKVAERITKFSRISPANRNREQIIAANIDTLLIFTSIFDPDLNTMFIDRLLVSAILNKIKPIICVNKIDLSKSRKFINDLLLQYKKMKIEVHCISVLEELGIDKLKKKIINKKVLISGVSGAGKSSFLNSILGYKAQVVKEISERTNKGIHTTSFSKRYRLSDKGWIIDTPGIREFGIWDLSKEEIGVIFPDFANYYLHCKYTSCTHTHEPDCAVINAVNNEKIDINRYNSYLNIYDSL